MRNRFILLLAFATVVLTGCSDRKTDSFSGLFPDYSDVTIPFNIAPLNFRVGNAGGILVTVKGESGEYSFKGSKGLVKFPLKKWHGMLESEKGNVLSVTVKWRDRTDHSDRSESFSWTVATDPIDKYLSYRLIEPAYEVWKGIQIEQRDMESFKSVLIGDNRNADYC